MLPSKGGTGRAVQTINPCRPRSHRGLPVGRAQPTEVRSGHRLPLCHPCPQYSCAAEDNSDAG